MGRRHPVDREAVDRVAAWLAETSTDIGNVITNTTGTPLRRDDLAELVRAADVCPWTDTVHVA